MKKLGVTLLVCLLLVLFTGLTNVVVANAEDLGGTSDTTITTNLGIIPGIIPGIEPCDSTQSGDPYWEDGLTP